MKRFKSLKYAVGLVVGLMLLTAISVYADGGSIVLTGAADVTWTPDAAFTFEGKTLDGNAFNSTDDAGVSCVWGLVDGRGSGAGWNISLLSSNLTGLTNSLSQPITFTLESSITPAYNGFGLKVQVNEAAPDVAIKAGADGSMPVSGLTYNVDTAAFVTSADQAVLTAPVDQGMGGYDIDPLFTIYLPAGTYAGTGQITLTVTQADSPA